MVTAAAMRGPGYPLGATGGHIGRPLGGHEVAAAGAANGMIMVGGDIRMHDGQLPYILGAHRAGREAYVRQPNQAGGTDIRIVITHVVDVIGVGIGAVMTRMARLAARPPSAGRTCRAWWCRWRVGRRRFGRVLRMLVQACSQISELLPQGGVLLLELRHDGQQGPQGMPHEEGRSSPFVRRNTGWWQLRIIHSESMQVLGGSVNHPCGSVN
jgi:hypothetical protein